MILANNNKIIKISESESNLLLAFYQGYIRKKILLILFGKTVQVVFLNRVITNLLIRYVIILPL